MRPYILKKIFEIFIKLAHEALCLKNFEESNLFFWNKPLARRCSKIYTFDPLALTGAVQLPVTLRGMREAVYYMLFKSCVIYVLNSVSEVANGFS
jgi:hypothetical protein